VVTFIVLGLWVLGAPWEDFSISTVAAQRATYDRNPPQGVTWDAYGRGSIVKQFFRPDRRGDVARDIVRDRIIASALIIGGLLVWQLAGKPEPEK
jgi:hypothetical protein